MRSSPSPLLHAAGAAIVLLAAPALAAPAAGPQAVDIDSVGAYWAARDRWQLPDSVVAALRLRPGMVVADLGAGDDPPDSAAVVGLAERGFLEVVDLRSQPAGADSLRARIEAAGLHYANAGPEDLLAQINDPEIGIFVFGDEHEGVEAEIKQLAESGRLPLTACEWDLLFGIAR